MIVLKVDDVSVLLPDNKAKTGNEIGDASYYAKKLAEAVDLPIASVDYVFDNIVAFDDKNDKLRYTVDISEGFDCARTVIAAINKYKELKEGK